MPSEAIRRPATTLDEVIGRLDEIIARSIQRRSRLGFFACLYQAVTRNVSAGIAAGRFQDGARMERLDVLFANRYLQAVEAYEAGRRPPRSWLEAFYAASSWQPLVLQHLLLGVNAHINLDLGIAAAQTAPGGDLLQMKADFDEINRLLGEMLEEVQVKIARVSPLMGLLDQLGCRTDERICNFCLGSSRELAWRTAVRFAGMQPALLSVEIDYQDQVVAALGRAIHRPPARMRAGLLFIRTREANDVVQVIEALR